ncbi:MAG: DUF4493 domain-containing protein [Bacteroidales bacterium]|nr:DUF4493 domain-containing protein [Bacteroidales bacterium]
MSIKLMPATMAALTILAACSKQSGTEGNVRIALEQQPNLIDVSTKSSVGDFTALPSASEFTVTISDEQDNLTPVTDLSAPVTLAAGNYTATASYGSLTDEGFDKPCFQGKQTFAVTGGSSQNVTITVKLAGSIVKLSFTDNFTNYFSDYTFTITTGGGTVITLPKSETRAVFMDAYSFKISGILTNQSGAVQTFAEKEFKNLEPATCYTVKFDASNVGSNTITITFDETTVDADLVEVDLND